MERWVLGYDTKEQLARKVLEDIGHRPVVVSYITDETKYDMILTRLTTMLWVGDAKQNTLRGAVPPGDFVMVNLIGFGTCYSFKLLNNPGGYLHPSYVMEKLGMREPDAVNVAGFLQEIINAASDDD